MKNIINYLIVVSLTFINIGVKAEMAANTVISIKTTSGDIKIELFDDKAPKTSENFKEYIKSGYYNKMIFHRVIKDFMIQGGGFNSDMQEKETMKPIMNEANNMVSNERGTIAMARTNDPHSASAQFFINLKDNTFLDFKSETVQGWGYAVFGKVTEGMETIDKIKVSKTNSQSGHQDVPEEDVIIKSAKIFEDS